MRPLTIRAATTFSSLINFALIMGGDNLNSFHKWKNHELILQNHELYVYPRLTSTKSSLDNHEKINLVGAPIMQISSSFIRNAIKEKIPVKIVKGKAFLTNNLNPLITLFGSSSIASEIECLMECRKQK